MTGIEKLKKALELLEDTPNSSCKFRLIVEISSDDSAPEDAEEQVADERASEAKNESEDEWVNAKTAKAMLGNCSDSTIKRYADTGKVARKYLTNGRPVYLRSSIDDLGESYG